jgi:hypothetical protein
MGASEREEAMKSAWIAAAIGASVLASSIGQVLVA